MRKIPRDDPRAEHMATNKRVDAEGLAEFVSGKNRWVLSTVRSDGRPQMSLVTGTITPDGHLLIASYPQRAKTRNARRTPSVSVVVMGEEFHRPWIQIDGDAEVSDMPAAVDGLVEYYQCISGAHPDWDEYRQAMADQGKSIIRITPTHWGPISSGGFPPELFDDE